MNSRGELCILWQEAQAPAGDSLSVPGRCQGRKLSTTEARCLPSEIMDVENGTLVTNPFYKGALQCTPVIQHSVNWNKRTAASSRLAWATNFRPARVLQQDLVSKKMKVRTGKKKKREKEKKGNWKESTALEGRKQRAAEQPD